MHSAGERCKAAVLRSVSLSEPLFIEPRHKCVLPLQRDGCPKIVNLGSAKTDLFYERKKYGFKKR